MAIKKKEKVVFPQNEELTDIDRKQSDNDFKVMLGKWGVKKGKTILTGRGSK